MNTLTLDVREPDGGIVEQFAGTIAFGGGVFPFGCPSTATVEFSCEDTGTVVIDMMWIGRTDAGFTRDFGDPPPDMVAVTLSAADGGLAASRTLAPAWNLRQVNGPGCGPTCFSHRETLALNP